jgi:5-methylcytosine-specific restriction enzyme A
LNNNQYYDKYKRDKKSREFYTSTAWKKCRLLVLSRDNHLCQDCLKEKRLTAADMVHHIVEYRDNPSKGLELDNLISLCNPCHNTRHGKSLINDGMMFDENGDLVRKI